MKYTYIFLLLGLLYACAAQQSAPLNNEGEMLLEGTMKKMPWSKSTDSYCAGGSEYFVVEVSGEGVHVLFKEGSAYYNDWVAFDGKMVEVSGQFVERRIVPDPNEISQRPAGDLPFSCQVFSVNKIRAKN